MQNTTDIELGNIDTDKAIAVEIKHDDKLKEEDTAFFQVYTHTSLSSSSCTAMLSSGHLFYLPWTGLTSELSWWLSW